MTLVVAILTLLIVPQVLLLLARTLDGVVENPPRIQDVLERYRRIRIWHLVLVVAAIALVLAIANADDALPLGIAALAIVVVFVRMWLREFYSLMALRDDDLPGRFDKLIWAALLVFLAPVGVWLFRSYRLAHWPEPEPARAKAAPDAV